MAMGNKGLGRGLDALLGGVKEDETITSDHPPKNNIII